jgi:hypothetical protein
MTHRLNYQKTTLVPTSKNYTIFFEAANYKKAKEKRQKLVGQEIFPGEKLSGSTRPVFVKWKIYKLSFTRKPKSHMASLYPTNCPYEINIVAKNFASAMIIGSKLLKFCDEFIQNESLDKFEKITVTTEPPTTVPKQDIWQKVLNKFGPNTHFIYTENGIICGLC